MDMMELQWDMITALREEVQSLNRKLESQGDGKDNWKAMKGTASDLILALFQASLKDFPAFKAMYQLRTNVLRDQVVAGLVENGYATNEVEEHEVKIYNMVSSTLHRVVLAVATIFTNLEQLPLRIPNEPTRDDRELLHSLFQPGFRPVNIDALYGWLAPSMHGEDQVWWQRLCTERDQRGHVNEPTQVAGQEAHARLGKSKRKRRQGHVTSKPAKKQLCLEFLKR